MSGWSAPNLFLSSLLLSFTTTAILTLFFLSCISTRSLTAMFCTHVTLQRLRQSLRLWSFLRNAAINYEKVFKAGLFITRCKNNHRGAKRFTVLFQFALELFSFICVYILKNSFTINKLSFCIFRGPFVKYCTI